MSTKITFIGAAPSETTGADVVNFGGHTPASLDQNLANLRAATDRALTALGGFSASQTPTANKIPVVKADGSTALPGDLTITASSIYGVSSYINNGSTQLWTAAGGSNGWGVSAFVNAGIVESNGSGGLTLSSYSPTGGITFIAGTGRGTAMNISAGGTISAGADNSQTLGSASKRWSVVYAGTGTINTSDAREKTLVAPMTAAEIAAAAALAREIGTYQFLAAIENKGGAARHHVGMTVQRAIEVMESHGLDPFRYGFICYDSWEGQFVDHPAIEAREATETEPAVEARSAWREQTQIAGDRYSFRTDELNLFIARGFEARLSALEAA